MDRAGPKRDLPEHDKDADRVAERRPAGICEATYSELAQQLLDQGYEPLPIRPGQKRPAVEGWTTVKIDEALVDDWCARFGSCGVGLRTGYLVAVDIDILDADLAHQASEIVTSRLGDTILRVGRWPKRLLLYRTLTPFNKLRVGKIEVLGLGQQFVAFGVHPDTGRSYDWPLGESPLDLGFDALPLVDAAMIEALLAELQPIAGSAPSGSRRVVGGGDQGQTRNTQGLVIDGRDGWLSTIAFHAVHDAIERGDALDAANLAEIVWARFAETTDLSRPQQDVRKDWSQADAARKIRDKLRLQREGNLPARTRALVAPDYTPPSLDVDEARRELELHLSRTMQAVEAWHRQGGVEAPPRIGLRATVGLGKSTAARRHITDLVQGLAKNGLPHRILNFVPSLTLADETAAAWRALGLKVAVLRGYEALNPITRSPMCGDVIAVRAAAEAGQFIQSSVCFRSQKQHCPMFASCAKQANRHEVQEAQVVIAAYDAMFSGFAGDSQDFAMILVDEACWGRSFEDIKGLTIEALPHLGISGVTASRKQDAQGAGFADVIASRQRLTTALMAQALGEVTAEALRVAGIDAAFCEEARRAEYAALPDAKLIPGQSIANRKAALERSGRRALGLRVIKLWSAVGDLLAGEPTAVGKVWLVGMQGKQGLRPIRILRRKPMANDLARLPILHLDATLRQELAEVVLPGLEVSTVEARAPYQYVRLISGSFEKNTLCPDSRLAAAENQRRANRLQDCVDYVRWHAQRHEGRILVITYKAIETAFAAIPGVEVAHYNAVAGLDGWGDVSALFLIGRPLPSSNDLAEITGALFDRSVCGAYAPRDIGVALENGHTSAIRAIRHADTSAETLRAAICDDEIMQALGRGRGINRSAGDPLEVHILADVVLPLAHQQVQAWDMVRPDIMQRMLLAGLAFSSPKHAFALHPALFTNFAQAEKALQRGGFGGHFPIRDIYREMSVKSAQYRLGGRGQSWQRAWWIVCSSSDARAKLEAAIGLVAQWLPEGSDR
jgi:hypothetical protein